MRPQRKPIGGGAVAFIDVMACGLGAVVLLLVIVDFNIEELIPTILRVPERVEVELPDASDIEERLASVRANNAAAGATIAELTAAVLQKETERDRFRESLKQVPVPPEPRNTKNESGDLLGLKVDGTAIVILLDSSGSMYSELLAENTYYAVAPSATKASQSVKWNQAKRAALWVANVAPSNSKIHAATFAETASPVFSGWQKKQQAITQLDSALASMSPKDGTDLEQALNWLSKVATPETQVFLITDGLPTKLASQGRVSRFFSSCSKDPKGFVGGDCRDQIFAKSVTPLSRTSIELNVILLPLEGDPKAAPSFWALAKSTNGLVFVPEQRWP